MTHICRPLVLASHPVGNKRQTFSFIFFLNVGFFFVCATSDRDFVTAMRRWHHHRGVVLDCTHKPLPLLLSDQPSWTSSFPSVYRIFALSTCL